MRNTIALTDEFVHLFTLHLNYMDFAKLSSDPSRQERAFAEMERSLVKIHSFVMRIIAARGDESSTIEEFATMLASLSATGGTASDKAPKQAVVPLHSYRH
jgi:hypothetical protein